MYPARRGAAALAAAGLAAALLTAAPSAHAAPPAPDEETAARGAALQEVIVHARRRDEKLADAPLAISVRSGEQLHGDLALGLNLFGGALAVSGDVFYGKYDDMQRLLARLNPDGTPVTLVTNAGRARISGAELRVLTERPAPAWRWRAADGAGRSQCSAPT